MKTTPSDNDDEATPRPNPLGLDRFLRILVGAANKSNSEIGLTLSVGGVLISGMVCSPATYFDGLADELAAGADGNPGQQDFAVMVKEWAEDFRRPADDEPDDGWDVTLIHLRDARFFSPGQTPLPENQSLYWRGRLSSVDGFSWGRLQADHVSV